MTRRVDTESVSAVVVNHNGGERVVECVRALLRQTLALREIIVVDSGSSDGSSDRVRGEAPAVRVVELDENRGPAAARNAGLREARFDLVLLVDADVYLEPDGLRRMVAHCGDGSATVVCPRVVYHPERERVQCDGAAPHFVGALRLLRYGARLTELPGEPSVVGGCISACLLVERGPTLEAGGFDEDYFFYFEDLEFSLRLSGLGHVFVCEPGALAYHDRGVGTSGLSYRGGTSYPARRFYLTQRNRLTTLLIHYRFRSLLVLLPVLAICELGVLALALRRGWMRDWARAWAWQFAQGRLLRSKRRRIQKARCRNDRDLLSGGGLPLASGLIDSPVLRSGVALLSSGVDAYWRVVRRLAG